MSTKNTEMQERNYQTQIKHSPIKRSLDLSPSRKTISKSIVTGSKNLPQSAGKSTVSYGQLQIILENISQIKSKATNQVKTLEKTNTVLINQIEEYKSKCIELSRTHEEFEQEKDMIKRQYEGMMELKQKGKEELEQENKDLKEECKKMKESNSEYEENNNELKDKLAEETQLRGLINDKYQQTVNIITNHDQSQLASVLYHIQNQIPQGNIIQLTKQFRTLQQQLSFHQHHIAQLALSQQDTKNNHQQNADLIQKLIEENRSYATKILEHQNQVRQLEGILRNQQKSYQIEIIALKEELYLKGEEQTNMANNAFSCSESTQEEILRLRSQLESRQREVEDLREEMRKQKNEGLYCALIDEVCDEGQDLEHLVKKLQYLERFKSEHYFNVQKIEYLCQMLDH